MSSRRSERSADRDAPEGDESPDMGDLFDELEELADLVDHPDERARVREAMRTATEAQEDAVFGRVVWGFDRADLSEAVLGALLFGIPMAVEGGTNEAGEFLATRPFLLAGTVAATVAIVVGILYVADIQDVRVRHRFLGVIPHRLAGVLGTAFVMSLLLLTAWGRINWGEPGIALSTCLVALLPMSIGAALGDILPGS
jgi:uncharacterized membrane protein